MAKIAYNCCFGGFSLSAAGVARGREISGDSSWGEHGGRDLPRHDPVLIAVIEELGSAANGDHASLCIEELPPGTRYRIDEYDGNESVETPNSYEWTTAP